MALSLGILLECVGDGDWSIAKVLPVHGLNSRIRGFEAGKADEGVALGVARVRISHDLESMMMTMIIMMTIIMIVLLSILSLLFAVFAVVTSSSFLY